MSDTCNECGGNKQTSPREYYAAVQSIVTEIRDAIMSGELDEDDVEDRLHEEIDGSWWVIYTHAAIAVLTHSPNDGAYIEEYGTEGVCDGGMLNWSRLAYGAMMADVREDLDVSAWIEERDAAREEREREEGEEEEDTQTADQLLATAILRDHLHGEHDDRAAADCPQCIRNLTETTTATTATTTEGEQQS